MSTVGRLNDIPTYDPDATKYVDKSRDTEEMQADFLKLLTAQLQYQDPMKPMENSEFTGQLAQFSSLSQQKATNVLLEKLIQAQGGSQMNQAVTYLGKQVVTEGNHLEIKDGEGAARFRLEGAASVTLSLLNARGEKVKEIPHLALGAGDQRVELRDPSLSDGDYRIAVTASDGHGGQVGVIPMESGVVKSVFNSEESVLLEVNGRRIPVDKVHWIEQAL